MTGTTRYYGALFEESPTGLVKYYYAGSRLLARKDAKGTSWYHQDHLGSTRLVTDKDGKVIQRADYEPFGKAMPSAPTSLDNDIGFAGQRTDEETGLVYMRARYYDPTIARFISADSIVPGPYDPQALNRYSYVYNNPLSFVDPSGHMPIGPRPWEPSLISLPTSSFGQEIWRSEHWMLDSGDIFWTWVDAGPGLGSWYDSDREEVPRTASTATASAVTATTVAQPVGGTTSSANPSGSIPISASGKEGWLTGPILPQFPDNVDGFTDEQIEWIWNAYIIAGGLGEEISIGADSAQYGFGFQFNIGANGCAFFCFLQGDGAIGLFFTPPGPKDQYFGNVHLFASGSGAILGVTPSPAEDIPLLTTGMIPGAGQESLGLSAGVGVGASVFVTQATSRQEFGGWFRNVVGGVGPGSLSYGISPAGQWTYSGGLQLSIGAGVYVSNGYTVVSPGLFRR